MMEKRFADAEKLLIDGYLATADPPTLVSADRKAAADQAGDWIIQLYRSWGKPDSAAEWTKKLGLSAAIPKN